LNGARISSSDEALTPSINPLLTDITKLMKRTSAILVNPATKEVQSVIINGYDGIKKLLGRNSHVEGSTLCQFRNNIYLQSWGDCEQYLIAPAFISTWNPKFPMHGVTVIDSYDIETSEAVNCRISAENFLKTIEWEPVESRVNPERPNPDWIQRFHVDPNAADIVIQYGD
jgi:hypothetical protein